MREGKQNEKSMKTPFITDIMTLAPNNLHKKT